MVMVRGAGWVFIGLLVAGVGVGHIGPVGADTGCDQPFEPVYAFYAPPSSFGSSSGVAPTAVSSLLVSPLMLDTDADGAADKVVPSSPTAVTRTVTLTRGDGDVVLTRRNGYVVPPVSLGDLNADGRSDFTVASGTGDPSANPPSGTVLVVIAGPLAPGTYDVTDIGVRMPPAPFVTTGVGDQNADGFDDVAAGTDVIADRIISGPEVLAPGPGGELTSLPPSIVPIQGTIAAAFRLADSGPPALADTIAGVQLLPAGTVAVFVHDGDDIAQLATTMPLAPNDSGPVGIINAFLDTNGHHIVELKTDSRSGTSQFDWDLDVGPCTSTISTDTSDPTTTQPTTHLARTGTTPLRPLELGIATLLFGVGLLALSESRRRLC